MKAIAIFQNGLGNWILLMPALAAMASMTNSKTIDIVLPGVWKDSRRKSVEDICRAWPVIDKIINWPQDQINPSNYGLWYYSPHGMNGELSNMFMTRNKVFFQKPHWRQSLLHESDYYMNIARVLGYKDPIPKVIFPISGAPVLNLSRPVVGLCNGFFRTKRAEWTKKAWPHFAKLSMTMKRFFKASVVGIGFVNELNGVPVDLDFTGKLSITETAKVISQLDCLITTDTGNMHLADILNIPVLALFGPTLVSKNRPTGKGAKVLRSGLSCSPCQDTSRFTSCAANECMKSISVGDVTSVTREMLSLPKD